jgi:hypothetical protein
MMHVDCAAVKPESLAIRSAAAAMADDMAAVVDGVAEIDVDAAVGIVVATLLLGAVPFEAPHAINTRGIASAEIVSVVNDVRITAR